MSQHTYVAGHSRDHDLCFTYAGLMGCAYTAVVVVVGVGMKLGRPVSDSALSCVVDVNDREPVLAVSLALLALEYFAGVAC